jgi:hypothetical protein
MDEMERKLIVELLQATLQEDGYKVENRFGDDIEFSMLRVFSPRSKDHRSFLVKVVWPTGGGEE